MAHDSVAKQILTTGLLMVSLGLVDALAWDGNWTQAESGRGDVIYDPGNSQGSAGTPERPQKFFIPPPRDWADVDAEETGDYKGKDYTPYALARVHQAISYQGRQIPKGYYIIKPGDSSDGSPNIHLNLPEPPSAQTSQLQPVSNTASTAAAAPSAGKSARTTRKKEPKYNVFVVKKLGTVIAVVPIHRMEHYSPPRKEKVPKQALAWMDLERSNGVERPVLKFYYKQKIYSTDFE